MHIKIPSPSDHLWKLSLSAFVKANLKPMKIWPFHISEG